jgi:hypothetical protein
MTGKVLSRGYFRWSASFGRGLKLLFSHRCALALVALLLSADVPQAHALPPSKENPATREWERIQTLLESMKGHMGDQSADDCPPQTKRPPTNCDDVLEMARVLGIRKGYEDADGDGTPDVLRRPYERNYFDCTTGNAHVECMFNDACTEQWGELLMLRSNSARHATSVFVAKDGSRFECDFTPDSSGIYIINRPDVRVGPGFTDGGEYHDPAYNCLRGNGGSRALNPGGILGKLSPALLGQLLSQLNQSKQGSPTPTPIPTPTPTPTPTATSVATENPEWQRGGDWSGLTEQSARGAFGGFEASPSVTVPPARVPGASSQRPGDAWEDGRGAFFEFDK